MESSKSDTNGWMDRKQEGKDKRNRCVRGENDLIVSARRNNCE